MPGTVARFDTAPCARVAFRRSAGMTPNGCTVVLIVDGSTFHVLTAGVSDIPAQGPNASSSSASANQGSARVEAISGGGMEGADSSYVFETGSLVLAEAISAEDQQPGDGAGSWSFGAKRLHVQSWERLDAVGLGQGFRLVSLALTDDRAFWGLGFVDRTRFGRDEGAMDALPAAEDIDPDTGERWKVSGIARYLVGRLPFQPELKRLPKIWEGTNGTLKLPRAASPRVALTRFLDKYPARIVLNLDASVSFWLEGEAKGQPSPDGKSPTTRGLGVARIKTNTGTTVPDSQIEFLHGHGLRSGRIERRPPVAALVTGGPRIRTVEEELEPVILVGSHYLPLAYGLEALRIQAEDDEEDPNPTGEMGIRAKRYADRQRNLFSLPGDEAVSPLAPELMSWVKRVVLRPETLLGTRDDVYTRAIRDQAFRLWRIVGADSWNSHALPVLNQAEKGPRGNRLPPVVIASSWTKRSGYVVMSRYIGSDLPRISAGGKTRGDLTDSGGMIFQEDGVTERPDLADDVHINGVRVVPKGAESRAALNQQIVFDKEYADVTSRLWFAQLEDEGHTMWIIDENQAFQKYNYAVDMMERVLKELESSVEASIFAICEEVIQDGLDQYLHESAFSVLDESDSFDGLGDIKAAYKDVQKRRSAADVSGLHTGSLDIAKEAGGIASQFDSMFLFSVQFAVGLITERVAGLARNLVLFRSLDRRDQLERAVEATLDKAVFHTNDPPSIVLGAQPVDRAAGVFETPKPVGHLDNPAVDTLGGSSLVVRPVRARFAYALKTKRPASREDPLATHPADQLGAAIGGQLFALPFAKNEADEHFFQYYKSTGGTMTPLEAKDLAAEELISLSATDLVELIQLNTARADPEFGLSVAQLFAKIRGLQNKLYAAAQIGQGAPRIDLLRGRIKQLQGDLGDATGAELRRRLDKIEETRGQLKEATGAAEATVESLISLQNQIRGADRDLTAALRAAQHVDPPPATTNRLDLVEDARKIALAALRLPKDTVSAQITFMRPWAVDCDGVIAGIEIEGRGGVDHQLLGFRTTVSLGRTTMPFLESGSRTRAVAIAEPNLNGEVPPVRTVTA